MHRAILAAFAILLNASPAFAQHAGRHGGHAAHLGADVMPFDLARSLHVFTPLADGGTQDVVSRDGDPAQIALIRRHLKRERDAFARGDYGDPSAIHGKRMPGLKALSEGARDVRVTYGDLPNGARLRFASKDKRLVAALHRWFAAQVRDHGADAVMGKPDPVR